VNVETNAIARHSWWRGPSNVKKIATCESVRSTERPVATRRTMDFAGDQQPGHAGNLRFFSQNFLYVYRSQ